jgi:UDPglucose--hexose-1-phosphate uridylyltransferase
MDYESHTQSATFNSPIEDFEEVTKEIEVRRDQLTGRTARVADGVFIMPEEYDIESVVSDNEGCFFCPELVEDATPTYADWFGEKRGARGEAVSFPNLNPYGGYSNVVVLTETHFQPMEAFTDQQFADGFGAALEYIRAVREHDSDAGPGSVNMNFLRSAGSSLVHPHMQTLVGEFGTNEQRRLRTASREYHEENDSIYWRDLVAEERGGERWLGETDGVEWFVPFAPRHHWHVTGVLDCAVAPDSDDDIIDGLADGLTNVLAAYADLGLNAFNLALHLPDDDTMPPLINVVARSVFSEYYWSDSSFFTVLHDEGVVQSRPEDYATGIREQF